MMTAQDLRWLRHEIDGAHDSLSPRESMLQAMLRFERANLLDALGREYRRGNAYKYALMLTWALIAVAAVIAGARGL